MIINDLFTNKKQDAAEGLLSFMSKAKPVAKNKKDPVDPYAAKLLANRHKHKLEPVKLKIYQGPEEYRKDKGMAENQDWMKDLAARAAAKSKPGTPYVPPKQDAEKQRRDLTAKYPNIDELVADAERNRDPYYDRAEGEAYYRGRDAEQQYQRLRQIQRVIQGLNESLQRTQP